MEQPLRAEARPRESGSRHVASPPAPSLADCAITVVVPLYNERDRFERFAHELVDFVAQQPPGSELLFVDDGSSDGTAQLVELLQRDTPGPRDRVRLLRCAHRGKGAAVRSGLERARNPVAGFCDLDLSTPLADFARLIDAARETPILAIASRGLAGSHFIRRQKRVREFLGRSFNKAVQLALIPGITDTQCGAKVGRTELWRAALAFSREDGFAWDVEVLAIAATLDIPIQEIAVEWKHEDQSKVRVLRDGTAMLRSLARMRRRLRGQARALEAERAQIALSQTARVPGRALDTRAIAALAGADGTHWWFRSKAAMVNWALERWCDADRRLVDLGAGAGGVTAKLGFSPGRAIAVEANPELARAARRRHPLDVVQSDLEEVPLASASAGVVCLLDIIETLPEPGASLREAHRLLASDGRLIVNVPGHPRLWSASDVVLGHERRYTRSTLRAELERAGFDVLWCSHVFGWLVLPTWLRRRRRAGEPQLGVDVDSVLVDRCALLLAWAERVLLRFVTLPFGTSVLAVARPRDPRTSAVTTTTQRELMELQETLYTSRNPTRRWLHNTRRDRITAELTHAAASGPNRRALEVGPGSGVYLPTLAALYEEVVATDIEEAFLDHARTLAGRFPNLAVRADDITASRLEPQSFDTVLCSEVIEHIADSSAALAGMYRALRPGGLLVLSTPQRYSPLEVFGRIAFHPAVLPVVRMAYREPILPTGHINLLTRTEACRQLRDAGFEILRTAQSGVYIPVAAEVGGRVALRVEQHLERRMSGRRLGALLWVQYYVARRP